MAKLQRVLVVLSLFLVPSLFAQSADQQITATDSADPVVPGVNYTYNIQVQNNGPNAATNGGVNINLGGNIEPVSIVAPGLTCTQLSSVMTCNTPSLASGASATVTLTARVAAHRLNWPDGSVTAQFSTAGVTADPNSNNNSVTVTTAWDSPQIDLGVSVTDSPDPVMANNNITYTAQVTNAGPNTATNLNFNVVNNGSLRFVSAAVPAGWNCTLPAVGAFPTFTCTATSFASGASSTFTVVVSAEQANIGINDTTVLTNFNVNGTGNDTNTSNDSENEVTAYVTPDADISVTATDAPDPFTANDNLTYTVQVANAGPAAATSSTMTVYNNGSLLFVSATIPSGWNCTLPAVNAFIQFTCTNPSLAVGASSTFTVVGKANPNSLGIADTSISTSFSAGTSAQDPNNNNNLDNETTAYVTPDADMSITATDSPDPVNPEGNITYTATVGNAGPDAAPNAVMTVYNNGVLQFVSATVPAGWNCTLPAVGSAAQFTCTNPSFAVGASSVFTVVLKASGLGVHDGTVQTSFTTGSSIADPNNANNTDVEVTGYDAVTVNVGVTATDSPDPVNAGSNITYTGTVTNAGPDAAPNTTLTIALHSNLLFQSLSAPSGFSCTTPAVGANGLITCTIASFPNGGSAPFSIVAQVNPAIANGPDGFIQTGFVIGSNGAGDTAAANNEITVTTQYLTPDADLSVTNTDTPDPVATGGTITYTQTVTNNGPDTAMNVTVTEALSPSVGFVSLVAPAGYSCTTPAVGASGAITCTTASLTSGASGVFTVVVNVIATSGTVSNTITADAVTYDPDASDDSATAGTTIIAAAVADLSLNKSTAATSAAPGTDITYTITLTNSGPDAAAAVVLTDTLPAQLLFRSIAAPAGFTCTTPAVDATGTITCNAASVANGATATFTLVARVAPGATSGTVTNTANVTSTTSDPDSGDRTAPAGGVALAPALADLSLTKTTATTNATPGTDIQYSIVVTNSGPNAAAAVVMTDTLPAQLLFRSISAPAGFTCTTPAVDATGTITCNSATLANGATATFTLIARVAPGATSGSVINTANVSSTTADPDSGDTNGGSGGVALAPASVDLSLTKTTAMNTATTGSTVTYTITVGSNGPSTASNVVVTDVLPAGLQFVSATPTQGTCSGTTTVTCSLGSLAAGGSATITLRALVTASTGTIANTATVTAAEPDSQPGNNSSSTPPVPVASTPEEIPTLAEWALIALAAMFGLIAVTKLRT